MKGQKVKIKTLVWAILITICIVSLFCLVGCDVQQVGTDINNISGPVSQAINDVNITDINSFIDTVQRVNAATTVVNPYAPAIALGIEAVKVGAPLLLAIIAWLSKKKNEKALTEVIKGNEGFKTNADEGSVETFKLEQVKAQSSDTRKLVAQIKATV
jgi:hypothetical protein